MDNVTCVHPDDRCFTEDEIVDDLLGYHYGEVAANVLLHVAATWPMDDIGFSPVAIKSIASYYRLTAAQDRMKANGVAVLVLERFLMAFAAARTPQKAAFDIRELN